MTGSNEKLCIQTSRTFFGKDEVIKEPIKCLFAKYDRHFGEGVYALQHINIQLWVENLVKMDGKGIFAL